MMSTKHASISMWRFHQETLRKYTLFVVCRVCQVQQHVFDEKCSYWCEVTECSTHYGAICLWEPHQRVSVPWLDAHGPPKFHGIAQTGVNPMQEWEGHQLNKILYRRLNIPWYSRWPLVTSMSGSNLMSTGMTGTKPALDSWNKSDAKTSPSFKHTSVRNCKTVEWSLYQVTVEAVNCQIRSIFSDGDDSKSALDTCNIQNFDPRTDHISLIFSFDYL